MKQTLKAYLMALSVVAFGLTFVFPHILDQILAPQLPVRDAVGELRPLLLNSCLIRKIAFIAYYVLASALLLMSLPDSYEFRKKAFHPGIVFGCFLTGIVICFGLPQSAHIEVDEYAVKMRLNTPMTKNVNVDLTDIDISKSRIRMLSGLHLHLKNGDEFILYHYLFHGADLEHLFSNVKAKALTQRNVAGSLKEGASDSIETHSITSEASHQAKSVDPGMRKLLWMWGIFPLAVMNLICWLAINGRRRPFATKTQFVIRLCCVTVAVFFHFAILAHIVWSGIKIGLPFWILWFLATVVTFKYLGTLRKRLILHLADIRDDSNFQSRNEDLFEDGLPRDCRKTVRDAIANGVDVNMTMPEGDTALCFAAHAGMAEICDILLHSGALPNCPTERGHLPLHAALANLDVSTDRRAWIARMLLGHGANPRLLDWGRPALHFALDDQELTAILLARGADVNQISEYHELAGPREGQNYQYHENALRFALKLGVENAIIQTLLNAGADPLLQNSEGDTAWDFAFDFPLTPYNNLSKSEQVGYLNIRRACDHAKLALRKTVEDAKFDFFVSYAEGDGWGEFFRGRLDQTGKRIWSAGLLKPRLPYYESVLVSHVNNAPAAVIFLSAKSLSKEVDLLVAQFTKTPEKLLLVLTGGMPSQFANRVDFGIFEQFPLNENNVTALWSKVCALSGCRDNWSSDMFCDLNAKSKAKHDAVFCSYRSSDANSVRFLMEQLFAGGARPWFAEYDILVSGRRYFQEAINHGIASSKGVLCCTNRTYSESRYCRIEAMQVLTLPGKDAREILDVQMPPDDNDISASIHARGSSKVIMHKDCMQSGWSEICRFAGVGASELPIREEGRLLTSMELERTPFTLRSSEGWTVTATNENADGKKTKMAAFKRSMGSISITGTLVVGDWVIEQGRDERALFENVIRQIPQWNREQGKIMYPRGIHVLHIPALLSGIGEQLPHPAFTYLDPGRAGYRDRKVPIEQCIWHRKYCIRVTPPQMPSEMEFCFDFDMRGVAHDDFATFCRHAYMMDDLVRGLRFG